MSENLGQKLKGYFRPVAAQEGIDPLLKSASNSEHKDTLGAYPKEVRIPVLEGRRYLWTTRVFAVAFYMSMLLNIMLVLTIYTLVPLKKIEPMLVTFNDKKEQIVQIQPFVTGQAGIQLFTEKMAGEYVKVREEIILDQTEQQRRWVEYLKYRMPEAGYNAFLTTINQPYQELQQKGISRSVDITSTVSRSQNYIEVDYITTDTDRLGNVLLKGKWKARLQVDYVTRNVALTEQYFNPLGFTVLDYSIAQN
jgi:type IV secretory pathway component VirB8